MILYLVISKLDSWWCFNPAFFTYRLAYYNNKQKVKTRLKPHRKTLKEREKKRKRQGRYKKYKKRTYQENRKEEIMGLLGDTELGKHL